LADYPRRINKFFHEVRVEMKLVNWPSWEDVKSTTTVVIVTVAFFAVYFLLTDTIFSRWKAWSGATSNTKDLECRSSGTSSTPIRDLRKR
jgi:preprotein translocase subunit SecE